MIRNCMTKPQDKAGSLLKPKNSRESRLFFYFFPKRALISDRRFAALCFFAGVKITMPTHQKFASAIFFVLCKK